MDGLDSTPIGFDSASKVQLTMASATFKSQLNLCVPIRSGSASSLNCRAAAALGPVSGGRHLALPSPLIYSLAMPIGGTCSVTQANLY